MPGQCPDVQSASARRGGQPGGQSTRQWPGPAAASGCSPFPGGQVWSPHVRATSQDVLPTCALGDAKATAGGSSWSTHPPHASGPGGLRWLEELPRLPTALTGPSGDTQVPGLRRPSRWVGGGRKPPAQPGPLRALEGAGTRLRGCCLHQAPRAWVTSPTLQSRGLRPRRGGQGTDAQPLPRGAQRARRDGRRTHLVAQLLGLLLQHGVALLVPAHVLVVAKPLHVFQLLVRNFQLLLVVVVFFNFDFKVLQLLLGQRLSNMLSASLGPAPT